MFKQIVDVYKARADVLVNNAGIAKRMVSWQE
jgi:NAD(P)-dependent dehydrogenase (short-subunit alcohol dehydrogenase family)